MGGVAEGSLSRGALFLSALSPRGFRPHVLGPAVRQQIQSQISGAQKSFNATTKARDIERIIQSAKGESGRGGMWKGQGIGGLGGTGKIEK